MVRELDSSIDEKVTKLCKKGDEYARQDQYEQAKVIYRDALNLLPDPKSDWEAATWIYAAMGDANYYLGLYQDMLECFIKAIESPNGFGNPFIHLRLGQAHFELGDTERAVEQLTNAYMAAGVDIFMEDDPKYLAFLESQVDI